MSNVTVVVEEAVENGQKMFVEKTQIVDQSGGLEKVEMTVRKFICDGPQIRVKSWTTDNKIQDNRDITDYTMRDSNLYMVDPKSLGRKGTTWTLSFDVNIKPAEGPPSEVGVVSVLFEVVGPEKVTVPAGTYDAIKVKRVTNKNELYEWFVEGIGMVKRDSKEGTGWEMKEYSGLRHAEVATK